MVDITQYLNNILVVYKYDSCKACNKICTILNKLGYPYKKKIRTSITAKDFEKSKLVIIVAGDGTVLRTCKYIQNGSIVFGVNSNPTKTEGFLTRATLNNFESKFKKLVKGKAKLIKLPRLEVKINKKLLPYHALNEVSISKGKPYLMFIYSLKRHVEKATGILISTPIGTTAWVKSAGGKKLPMNSAKMEYVIREPYIGNIYYAKKKYDFVNEFSVKALSSGIIVFDSVTKEFPFKKGVTISIKFSKSKVNFLEP